MSDKSDRAVAFVFQWIVVGAIAALIAALVWGFAFALPAAHAFVDHCHGRGGTVLNLHYQQACVVNGNIEEVRDE